MATPPKQGGIDVPVDDGLPARLREARRAKGLVQQEVADALGVSRRAVSEWETGLRKPHTSLPGLSALYDVSTTFLLYGVEPSSVELQQLREEVVALTTAVANFSEQTAKAIGALHALLIDALARPSAGSD